MTFSFRARLMTVPVFAILLVVLAVSRAVASDWRDSVDPALLAAQNSSGELDFIVRLHNQADLSPALELVTKEAKGEFVYRALRSTASRTQSGILAELTARDIKYQSFWIINAIHVRADASILQDLAGRADVDYIFANSPIALSPPVPVEADADLNAASGVEWNVELIRAPELWAMLVNGEGTVIGGQDTGYQWDHPALVNQYRGWNDGVADHNYNWHDAITVSNDKCAQESPEPCDDLGHGTHTMGIIVGDDGGDNKIGVAPGARWIGCRNMNKGVGTPATYIDCFQWFIAPTKIGGGDPDPSRAPDIINNSWSCPVSEGCIEPEVLHDTVTAVRAAGILTVQSAGNSGSGCATINTPAAIYDETFTIGASDSSDQIAGFSSRGPVLVDGSNRLKPDVVAPGVNVRSSYADDVYTTLSGTSMAAPHVAGLAALLISAEPELSGDVERLEQAIVFSAVPKTTLQNCGSFPGDQVPNAVFGRGRVDAVNAWLLITGSRYYLPLLFVPSGSPSSLLREVR